MKNKKPQFIATFLLATFAIGTSASAQQAPFKLIKKDVLQSNSYKKAQQFLNVKHSTNSNRPTTQQQRVLSQVYLDSDNLPSDSTTYTYSNMRGSDFDYYDFDFEYNIDHEPGIVPSSINPANMYSSSMSAFADTIKSNYSNNNNGQFTYSKGYYRSDNQIDSIITGFGDNTNLTPNNKIENTFNTAGQIQSTTRLTIGNTTDYSIDKYNYNAASTLITEDSLYYTTGSVTQLDLVTSYKYNANNKLDSILTIATPNGISTVVDFTAFSYNSNNMVQSVHYYELEPTTSVFELSEVDSFTYFNNFDAYQSVKYYSYDGGQIDEFGFIQGTLGVNGYPDSLKAITIDYDFNDTTTATLVFEYNSFNNPIKIRFFDNDTLDGGTNFRYQEYDDSTTSIKSIVNNSFEMFPNPFSNQISINNKSDLSGVCTISLTDFAGRIVFESNQSIHAGQNDIAIPQLAKGIYILELQNEKGIHFNQKVVKE